MTTHYAPLRGVFHRGRDGSPAPAIVKVLPGGTPFQIVPEPENPYDSNALRVFVKSSDIPEMVHQRLDEEASGYGASLQDILDRPDWFLGYVAKEVAAIIKADEILGASLTFAADGKPQVRLETRS